MIRGEAVGRLNQQNLPFTGYFLQPQTLGFNSTEYKTAGVNLKKPIQAGRRYLQCNVFHSDRKSQHSTTVMVLVRLPPLPLVTGPGHVSALRLWKNRALSR